MRKRKLKFTNLTISGKVATGTTTLLSSLRPYLEPLGWKFYYGGQFVREFAKKNGLKLEDADGRGDEFTKKLDAQITHRLKNEESLAIESWLAGYDAQGIENVLKVLLVCSDEAVIIDRLVNRDHISVEAAKEHVRLRTDANIAKWQRIYGKIDFWDPKYYDLVINTFSNGPTETVELTLKALGYYNFQKSEIRNPKS